MVKLSGLVSVSLLALLLPSGFPWAGLGGSGSGGGISDTPDDSGEFGNCSVAVDGSGNPVVAWCENVAASGFQIYVKRWNGAAWEELGGSASGNGISNNLDPNFWAWRPVVSVDATGNPTVAWLYGFLILHDVYVRRWNGTTWEELDGSASGGGVSNAGLSVSSTPALSVDSSGNPVVAWDAAGATAGTRQIYLKRWDGTAWTELASSGSGDGVSQSANTIQPTLALDSADNPMLVWKEAGTFGQGPIHGRKFDGAAWVELGGSATGNGISNLGGVNWTPVVAMDDADLPIVAWSEGLTNSEIYVRRFNGTSWVGMNGSASGGGISNTGVDSELPSLVVTSDGHPVVVWMEGAVPIEIYGRIWDGTAWQSLTLAGPNLTNNTSQSVFPHVAAGPDGLPVMAWVENIGGTADVYLLKFQPCPPAGEKQFRIDGVTGIGVGSTTPEDTVLLQAAPGSGLPGRTTTLEIEVRDTAEAFTGVPTHVSSTVVAGTSVTVSVTVPMESAYHWRSRVVDDLGFTSAWTSFGGNADGEADFVFSTAVGGGGGSSRSSSGDGGCSAGTSAGYGFPLLILILIFTLSRPE